MNVVAAVGADEQTTAVVQPGEGAFHDPAMAAKPGAVLGPAASNQRFDAARPDEPPVLIVVVAAVGDHRQRPAPRATDAAAHGWHPVEQLEQLGDVVAIAAGERPGERDAAAVYEEMVLAAAPAPVDWARTGFVALFSLAGGLSRRPPAPTRADRRRATLRAAARATSPTRPPAARRAACARRSSRNRSRALAAGAPSRSRCAARTRSPCKTLRSSSGLRPG